MSQINWQDKTILVAEDDDFFFTVLETMLTTTGAKVIRAKNGRQAVEMYKNAHSVNLVVMDLMMPDINGIEAAMLIRKVKDKQSIISITAFAKDFENDPLMKVCFDGFLQKPVKEKRLLEEMQRFMS